MAFFQMEENTPRYRNKTLKSPEIFNFPDLGVYLQWKEADKYCSPKDLALVFPPGSFKINPKFQISRLVTASRD